MCASTCKSSHLTTKSWDASKMSTRIRSYNAINTIENERVQLSMTEAEEQKQEWTIRPNFEAHEGDPVQLMYDRGHGVHDPFDEENPTQPS